jgi:HSP20 family protein
MSEDNNKSSVPVKRSLFSGLFEDDDFFNWPMLRKDVFPAVNISENPEGYKIELAAPGFNKEEIKVHLDHGMLSIEAESKKESEEKKDNYSRKEFSTKTFKRSFNIPSNVAEEKVEANYENGVLKIFLRKQHQEKSDQRKQIQVQ